MGTIHQLPSTPDAHLRLLRKLVDDTIAQHPDPDVARRWSDMARQTLSRYSGPPMPSQPVLDLDKVQGLSAEQVHVIQTLIEHWMLAYFDDVRDQLMQVHRELLSLQKMVAELEVGMSTR